MHLGYHGNGNHFEFVQLPPPKSCHTLRWIFLQSFMKFDERNQIFFKSPFFCFHGNCGKVCPTDSDFLAYLVPLDVDVVPIKFHQFLFASNLLWSFLCFSIFQHFGRFHGNGSHFEKINPWQHNLTWHMIFLQGFIKFDHGISEKSSRQKCVEE